MSMNQHSLDDAESGDDEVHRSTVCVGYMTLLFLMLLAAAVTYLAWHIGRAW